MKIYYFSDSTFLDMKNNFELSFKDDFDKQYQFIENINIDRKKAGSGIDIWKYKTEMIINAIKSNLNDIIVISDIDIIFYKPVIPTILKYMINNDICFQRENKGPDINIGFMSIYCNKVTLQFWITVYETICNTNKWDQEIVNDIIYNNYDIRWKLFPFSIWASTNGNNNLNKDIILHHANGVSKKEDKLRRLHYVSSIINKKN
jgi:hypothetical protein